MTTDQTASELVPSRAGKARVSTGDSFGGFLRINPMPKTYAEKLRDPRWQKRRLEVMERDKFTCRACRSKDKTLNVHHTHYRKGADPWDYDDNDLVTVCEECHGLIEERRAIILKATANPRIQIAILHFASVMNCNFGPYSMAWELVLADIHNLMEYEDEIQADLTAKNPDDAEVVLEAFERVSFGVFAWMHKIHEDLQRKISAAREGELAAFKSSSRKGDHQSA